MTDQEMENRLIEINDAIDELNTWLFENDHDDSEESNSYRKAIESFRQEREEILKQYYMENIA